MNLDTPPAALDRAGASLGILAGLRDIVGSHSLLVCDIWGVVHNGVAAFPEAADALTRYRAAGGRVVMVSNAPRPNAPVAAQLDALGLPRSAWDAIVTSGDLSRARIAARPGVPLVHLGPARDLPLFDGLDAPRVAVTEAAYVVCTGLDDDERETAEDYRDRLSAMAARRLPMICANPDLIVDRGGRLIPCAGALAALYAELGGSVEHTGKPGRPIYEATLATAATLGWSGGGVLAVGDAFATDIRGGSAMGWTTLMIARGIHAEELCGPEGLDPARLLQASGKHGVTPDHAMERLVW